MDERESGSFKSSLVRKRKKEKKKKENIFLFRGWAPPDDVIHSFHQFCTHTHTHTHERDPKNLFTQFWLEKERKKGRKFELKLDTWATAVVVGAATAGATTVDGVGLLLLADDDDEGQDLAPLPDNFTTRAAPIPPSVFLGWLPAMDELFVVVVVVAAAAAAAETFKFK
jgi:hypothetical protein